MGTGELFKLLRSGMACDILKVPKGEPFSAVETPVYDVVHMERH